MTMWTRPVALGSTLRKLKHRILLAGMFCLCAADPSFATSNITYAATDLPDVTSGQDLWHYAYALNGPLSAFAAVEISFSSDLFTALWVTNESESLSTFLTQPDPYLSADGYLNITAINDISVGEIARVEMNVVWKGIGPPGSQAYQVLDDQFNVVGTGQTIWASAPVPEPATVALMLAGLLVVLTVRKCTAARQAT